MILAVLAAALFAQVSSISISDPRATSATAISVVHEHDGISAKWFQVDVTAAGAWSFTKGGTCPAWGVTTDPSTPAGTGNGSFLVWKHHEATTTTPGTASCTIVLTAGAFSQTLTVTTTIKERWRPFYANWRRVAESSLSGTCAKTVSNAESYSICPVTDVFPGAWTPMAVGETRADPNFGAPVERIALGSTQAYSSMGGISKAGTYAALTQGSLPTNGIYTLADRTLRLAMNGGNVRWSTRNDGVYFTMATGNADGSGAAGADWVKRWTCNTNCTAPTSATVYTHTAPIDSGGTTQMSPEGIFGFWERDEANVRWAKICYFWEVTEAAYCAATTGITLGQPGWGLPVVSGSFSDGLKGSVYTGCSSKRCYLVVRAPYGPSGTPSTKLLVYYFAKPGDTPILATPSGITQPEALPVTTVAGAHAAMIYADGKIYHALSGALRAKYDYDYGIPLLDLDSLVDGNCTTNILNQEGGCWMSAIGNRPAAEYPSGSHSQVLVISDFDKSSASPEGNQILNYTHDGSTATITTGRFFSATNHGLSPGDSVAIQNVPGVAGANGTFTAQSGTTGNTVVVNGTFSGTWINGGSNDSLRGSVQKAVTQSWQSNNGYEINATRLWRRGPIVTRRLAKVRGVAWYTCLGAYEESFTRGQASYDGRFALYTENHGVPCAGGAHKVMTGFRLQRWTPPNHFNQDGDGVEIRPSGTTAIARLKFREGRGNCTLRYTAGLDVTLGTSVAMTSGGAYQVAVLTGLTSPLAYVYRVECDNWDAAAGEFRTGSMTGDATSPVVIEMMTPTGATSMQVDYGTSAALGSNTGVSCTAGAICRAVILGSRGINLHYEARMLSASGALVKASRDVVAVP